MLMRMFTHRVPEGAQGHFLQEWLLDWIPSNVGLAEPLVDVEFPKQYPACISTYRLHGLPPPAGRLPVPARLPARLTSSSWQQQPSRWQAGTAAYSGQLEPTGGPGPEHPVSSLPSA